MTDEARIYWKIGKEYAEHGRTLRGIGQYVKGDIHSNTVEGFFSIFKRGMRGVYQYCIEKHLHRYLAEFDFSYSNRQANGIDDQLRSIEAMKGISGKRLTYQTTHRK